MLKFKYTKSSGEVTDRVGIVLTKPNYNYSILDITSVNEDEREYIEKLYLAYEAERKALMKKYGLDMYFKAFKPEGISDVCTV